MGIELFVIVVSGAVGIAAIAALILVVCLVLKQCEEEHRQWGETTREAMRHIKAKDLQDKARSESLDRQLQDNEEVAKEARQKEAVPLSPRESFLRDLTSKGQGTSPEGDEFTME